MCGFFAGLATFIFFRTFIQPLEITSILNEIQLNYLLASIIMKGRRRLTMAVQGSYQSIVETGLRKKCMVLSFRN